MRRAEISASTVSSDPKHTETALHFKLQRPWEQTDEEKDIPIMHSLHKQHKKQHFYCEI